MNTNISAEWTVSVGYVEHVLQQAQEFSVPRKTLLQAVSITDDQLQDPEDRLPMAKLLALLHMAAQASGCEDFGLYIGRSGSIKSFGLLSYISMCCDTMAESIEVLPRYRKLLYDVGDTQLSYNEQGLAKVSWQPLSDAYIAERYLTDALFSTWISISQLICEAELKPCKVLLSYPQPANTTLLEETYGIPVLFSQNENSLYFKPEDLQQAMKNADRTMYKHLTEQAEKYISSLQSQDDLSLQLRETLTRLLPKGEVSIDTVAEILCMGRRTLQRRLSEQGLSFQKQLQTLRSELAVGYLSDKRLNIVEVALLLGYGDQSTFSNSFKSWYGLSPRDYRQQHFNLS